MSASPRLPLPVPTIGWNAADPALAHPLLVLMYHGLHDGRADPGHFDPRYSVRPAQFAAQMALLAMQRHRVVATPDSPAKGTAESAILISFDDGDVSNASIALPCLVDQRLPAAFFVTSGHLGEPGWLSPSQLRQLADAGMRIGSHGATHRFLNGLDAVELGDELSASRDTLQRATGRRVDWLALPGGRGAERECAVAKRLGYSAVFGSVPGNNPDPQQVVPLQRVAITRDLDLAGFAQILAWRGAALQRLRWRHRLLSLPRALLGDSRYDHLRNRLAR